MRTRTIGEGTVFCPGQGERVVVHDGQGRIVGDYRHGVTVGLPTSRMDRVVHGREADVAAAAASLSLRLETNEQRQARLRALSACDAQAGLSACVHAQAGRAERETAVEEVAGGPGRTE